MKSGNLLTFMTVTVTTTMVMIRLMTDLVFVAVVMMIARTVL